MLPNGLTRSDFSLCLTAHASSRTATVSSPPAIPSRRRQVCACCWRAAMPSTRHLRLRSRLTVVEPWVNGIGSDAFALIWDGKTLHRFNGSRPLPGRPYPRAIRQTRSPHDSSQGLAFGHCFRRPQPRGATCTSALGAWILNTCSSQRSIMPATASHWLQKVVTCGAQPSTTSRPITSAQSIVAGSRRLCPMAGSPAPVVCGPYRTMPRR